MNFFIVSCLLSSVFVQYTRVIEACFIPDIIHGSWFYLEAGKSILTEIDNRNIAAHTECQDMEQEVHNSSKDHSYTYVLKRIESNCHYCLRIFIRTPNVIEKLESSCITLPAGVDPTVKNFCNATTNDERLITLFNDNYVPINCAWSLEGSWQFAYESPERFTGTCNKSDALIQSCKAAGRETLIQHQKFDMHYRQCDDMYGTFNGNVQYSCLGDWFIGDKHYFVVANTKESRKYEKYRCFLKNRKDNQLLAVSTTAECNTLKSLEVAPERLKLTPVTAKYVEPSCSLPNDFVGEWYNPADIDADFVISKTHMNITTATSQRTSYVCLERQDKQIMMTSIALDGCQNTFVCIDLLPKQHNIIRYRIGRAVISSDFGTVCAPAQFQKQEATGYSHLLYARNPVPIRCPIAGRFNFTQRGDYPLKARSKDVGGITLPSLFPCKENISELSFCDTSETEMAVEINKCLAVDYLGRPVDIYSESDYKMQCIGFWKEHDKSYLITYAELNALYKYKCWVYQRVGENRLLLSQALGGSCQIAQNATSWRQVDGIAVAINAVAYEKDSHDCPVRIEAGVQLEEPTPVRTTHFEPKCSLPEDSIGVWINSTNVDTDIAISATHILVTDYSRDQRTTYICLEQHDNQIMIASLSRDGCPNKFVCVDFLPRERNIIRYRIGRAVIDDDFNTVCASAQFPNQNATGYPNFIISKETVPIRCPIAGRFNFSQRGAQLFQAKNWPDIHCSANINELSFCDSNENEMAVVLNKCLALDYLGRPVNANSDVSDYKVQCIGYWNEHNKSYLITFDKSNFLYNCWVYQRVGDNRLLLSRALGGSCQIAQNATSWRQADGVAVAIDAVAYEKVSHVCPVRFEAEVQPEDATVLTKSTAATATHFVPNCSLPQNSIGEWVNPTNVDTDIAIGATHIIVTDTTQDRQTTYTCHEQHDNQIMIASLPRAGYPNEYICVDFLPRHHNIIRYRIGRAVIYDDFNTVCAPVQFQNQEATGYPNFIYAKHPVPVRCPIAGRFNLTQRGEHLFQAKNNGISVKPRSGIHCSANITELSFCDSNETQMAVEFDKCLALDHLGRSIDANSAPDYKVQCISFWKEYHKSYLITYDELEPSSKYSCWVYQKVAENRVAMSRALGAVCQISQSVSKWRLADGVAVAIDAVAYENVSQNCPVRIEEGESP